MAHRLCKHQLQIRQFAGMNETGSLCKETKTKGWYKKECPANNGQDILEQVTVESYKVFHTSNSVFTGSFPNNKSSGFSSNSFTRTRKLTLSRPSIIR